MATVVGYHLPSDCSIAQIESLHRDLTRLLDAGSAVDFHCDAVNRIDAVGVQTLLAFVAAMTNQGLKWQWQNPSARLCSAVRLLGVGQLLNFPMSD